MANGPEDAARIFDDLASAIGDPIPEAELLELGHFATTLVLLRTKRGIDADGNRFRPYTESYTKVRRDAGYSSQPDLARTGHMLGAMTPTVTGRDEVSVQFNNALEATKAAAHNFGAGNEPRREFLDVRLPRELEALGEVLGNKFALRIEKKIGR